LLKTRRYLGKGSRLYKYRNENYLAADLSRLIKVDKSYIYNKSKYLQNGEIFDIKGHKITVIINNNK